MEFIKCLRLLDTDYVMKRKADHTKWIYCRLKESPHLQCNINHLALEDQDFECEDWELWKITKGNGEIKITGVDDENI